MNAKIPLERQISELQGLLSSLQKCEGYEEKLTLLNDLSVVKDYLKQSPTIQLFLKNLTPEAEYAIKSVIAIGQGPIIFNIKNIKEGYFERLLQLLKQLLDIEVFYQHMSGIIGYQLTMLKLIFKQQTATVPLLDHIRYIHPEGLSLESHDPQVQRAVRWGIENIKNIAMIYPLGGAGDRLNLKDKTTGTALPAALLPFLGRSLLEGLIRDLQAMEYLFFKLFGEQLLTPVAIMTSIDKNNHIHVLNICKACQWFGRPIESFYFFIQPVVPVVTIEGNWSLSAPLTLTLKPCGHGVIWKLAEECGVFNWLESYKRHHVLVRQINNPLAGTDQALLALLGIGLHEGKAFGFVSCERLINSDEGTNVLIETQNNQGYDYCLTNIEYTDFAQHGIGEFSAQPGGQFSIYPTNTNILFADISTIKQSLKVNPIPGQLINMKSKVSYIDPQGQQSFISGGRLESTMQNIADFIINSFPHRLNKAEYQKCLSNFIIYNKRSKTISTTKKSYQAGESLVSTPEQAYYDLLSNHSVLLKNCHFQLPDWQKIEDYLLKGPIYIFLFHPALGPLYSVIAQKIRKGSFAPGAELQLEIAEIDIENLTLEGSLIIESTSPLGSSLSNSLLHYGKESRCLLRNIIIYNQGINRKDTHDYWKNVIIREEMVKIILHEGAEFHAEDLLLKGSHQFEVPAYHRLVLHPVAHDQWKEELLPIQQPTWYWHYSFDHHHNLQLKAHLTQTERHLG